MNDKIILAASLLLYTLAVSYIGYTNRKNRSGEEYFLASRSLPSWLLAITFVASWWGGGSAIDLVNIANTSGISTLWIYGVPVLLATALMFLISSGIRKIGSITQSQLIEERYDTSTAFMNTIFIIIFMVIGTAIQVIVVGEFLQAFFGVSYSQGAIIGTSMVVFYSLFGGFRGVVLTDLLQFVFFLIAALILFAVSYHSSGGFENVIALAELNGKIGYNDVMHKIEDNIAFVLTFGTSWIVQANVWQRISAARSAGDSKRMMAISFFIFIPLYLIVTLTGMLTYSEYQSIPEGGIVANIISSLDSLWLKSLLFVGLCSAIMSTMDSLLNTAALTLTIDIYKRHINTSMPSAHYVSVGRLMTFGAALFALFIALNIRSIITVSWIGSDFIASGAFVPIIMAFFWRRGNSKGAFWTMIYGLIFSSYNFAVALGAKLPVAWEIASTKQAIIGMSGALLIYISVSLLTRSEKEKALKFMRKSGILKV